MHYRITLASCERGREARGVGIHFLTDSSMLTNKAYADPFANKDLNWKMN